MADIFWTPELVAEQFEEAVDTLRRLPEERVRTARSGWPPILYDFWEKYGQEPARLRLGPPLGAAIDRMDITLDWLRWLEPEDAKLVWARAEGQPWKAISWRFGLPVRTAQRRWQYALSLVTWRLQGRSVPSTWSRRFLVERVAFASSANCQ